MEESPAEAPVETPEVPASTGEIPVAETPAPEPAKRGRGRPPGAKNKPKIVVRPVEVPAEPVPTPAASSAEVPAAPAPKEKKARTVRVEEPKETIDPDVLHRYMMHYALSHANRQAVEARNQKANRYDALVARMVR